MDELKERMGGWKSDYEKEYKEWLSEQYYKKDNQPLAKKNERKRKDFESFYKQKIIERQKPYKTKYHFDNFDKYLQVYDLKKEGKSWAKIASTLNLNSDQTARNHYNAACEIIEKGVEIYVK